MMESSYDTNDSHYQSISYLGHCCNGIAVIHLSRHIPSNTLVAIKKFNMDKAKEDTVLIEHEIVLTRQFHHPNILPYLAAYVNGPEVCVISPLMAFGSCKNLIENHFTEGLPELAIAFIIRDVIQGLDYIHKKGYIHRAIRASHILVSSTGQACLTGFRYACQIVENGKWQKRIHSFPNSTANNLNWLSPEVLEQNLQGYNEKSDIYSIGITCCELGNGIVPFADMPTTLMLTEKVRGHPPPLYDSSTFQGLGNLELSQSPRNGEMGDSNGASSSNLQSKARIYSSRQFTDAFHSFTEICLEKNPTRRPSATELLHQSFFKLCKRGESVPDLLHPVMPINDQISSETDDWEAVLAAEKMQEMDINTCEWDF
ncbi:STE20-related kinase adapter protein alpha [Chrysoperla carnea]|uniref:STE20-related kinase adapter protein alpha n=1 Tax=Chrysoperla carnea TaxID=189513 RepID=UPI001D080298|nr:STE20-related kinase adapter protein alpha [Chrysoperla carnea]